MADEQIDVAIIGGGVAGLYCAWRLQRAHPGRTVVVFEGSTRTGGRLLSVRPPDIPTMVAELGGMRILPEVQPRIARLLQMLNQQLSANDQIALYDFPVDEPQNIAYLRGVFLRLADITAAPHKLPYQLSFLERGGTVGDIVVNAIEQIVPGISALGDHERQERVRSATFGGAPLYTQGFWNVLIRVISGEAYQLLVDAGGYSSTLGNWNAADAIPWYLADFGVAPKYKGFRRGFQEVPDVLARLFRQAGGDIRLATPVAGFDWADGTFQLRAGGKVIRATSLILAMPRRSLELLAPQSPPLLEIQELIASVTPRPLFKLFTTYGSPWWRAAGYTAPDGAFVPVEVGRSLSDLPVRQTYYWPSEDGTPVASGPAMVMASYDDGANISFWDGLRPRRGRAWREGREVGVPHDPFLGNGGPRPESDWDRYKAPRAMVAEVACQLAAIHGLSYTPEVRHAAFRDWGDDPYGGGWNSWNIGVKSWVVKQQIVKPFAQRPLYICGEAYSDAQGWVEGALQTADMVLEQLGIGSL